MIVDRCRETVRLYVDRINAGDVVEMEKLITEEHRFIDSMGTVITGRDNTRQAWSAYFGMVPDYRVNVDQSLAEGSTVVLLGTAQGSLSTSGTLDSRNCWQMPAAWRVAVRDGRVAEWQVYADNEVVRRILSGTADQ